MIWYYYLKRKKENVEDLTTIQKIAPIDLLVEVEADGNATPYMFLEIDDSRCVFTVHVFETEDYNNSEYHDKLIFYPHDFLDDSLLLEIVNNGSKYIYYKSEAIVSNNIDNKFMLTIKDKVNIMLLRFYTHKEEIRDYEKKLKDYNSLMDSLKNK